LWPAERRPDKGGGKGTTKNKTLGGKGGKKQVEEQMKQRTGHPRDKKRDSGEKPETFLGGAAIGES